MTFGVFKRNAVTLAGNRHSRQSILFAHGFGSDQTAWHSLAKGFARAYRLVLFDNVGAGRADPNAFHPNRYTSFHAFANDLLDICEELRLQRPILVAHSASCMIGLRASLLSPGVFSKMVFLGASPRYLNEEGYTGGFQQSDLDALYAAMHTNFSAWAAGFAPLAMGRPDLPHLVQAFVATMQAMRPDIAQAVARMIFQSDHRRQLLSVDTPTLILQTSQDMAVPLAVGHYLHQHMPASALRIVEAAGHLPHMSAPEEITAAIQAYVTPSA